jgi:AraC-like DNA-binding protein
MIWETNVCWEGRLLEPAPKKPSGLLHTALRPDKLTLNLYPTANELLEPYIEHYWIVRWDLRGQEPYVSENLPHPSVHIVFEPEQSYVIGVIQEKYIRRLQEKGFVFGIKFRPGAFYPFISQPVHKLTGQMIPVRDIWGPGMDKLASSLQSLEHDQELIKAAEAYLLNLLPEPDRNVRLIRTIGEGVQSDRTITTVEEMAARFHYSPRVLQRLFLKYVGVSPKWVIQRFRLLEVADHLSKGHPGSWPELAAKLGYYDQSHFIRDFKSIVGYSPEEYVRSNNTEAR